MGKKVTLVTRSSFEPSIERQLTIDWSQYEEKYAVEDVPLNIVETKSNEPPGTTIEIEELLAPLDKSATERLARALLLLADPFDTIEGFRPTLVTPEFGELEKKVKTAYFNDAAFYLVANLNRSGETRVRVTDPRTGITRWTATQLKLEKRKYSTAPAKFELWNFLLDGRSFTNRSSTVKEVRDWLEVVGGVHLYHRGLRVHPYGDQGHDWLDMNLLRVRNPELRPSTNNSVGRVTVADPSQILIEKTDRSGFLENEAFTELQIFAKDSLEWMARQRILERDRNSRKAKDKSTTDVSRAERELRTLVGQLPPTERSDVQRAVVELETVRKREERILRQDLQLYRTLASLGTTVAVFAHEAAKPVGQITRMAESIQRRGKETLGDDYAPILEAPVGVILRSAKALESYASFPLSLLSREKRQIGHVNVHSVIYDTFTLFEPFLQDANVDFETQLCEGTPKVWGSIAALESILSNLITNAVSAFVYHSATNGLRKLVVQTRSRSDDIVITVSDSGPGIIDMPIEHIWLAGSSSIPGGTGLGLTIVQDTVVDLGGQVHAQAHGRLGGADIIVTIPRQEVDD